MNQSGIKNLYSSPIKLWKTSISHNELGALQIKIKKNTLKQVNAVKAFLNLSKQMIILS